MSEATLEKDKNSFKNENTSKNKEKKSKSNSKQRKSLIKIIKEMIYELRKVTWTSKSKTLKNTFVVLSVLLFASILVYFMDTGISFFLKALIK